MDKSKLAKQLERDEDKRARMYRDSVGKWTVGIGRNLSDRDFSEDEIQLLLTNDIAAVEKELDRKLPWWRELSDARQNVLANMGFNMGVPTLLTFVRTLALVKEGKFAEAADAMLVSKWATQVGMRAVRLASQMRTGEFK